VLPEESQELAAGPVVPELLWALLLSIKHALQQGDIHTQQQSEADPVCRHDYLDDRAAVGCAGIVRLCTDTPSTAAQHDASTAKLELVVKVARPRHINSTIVIADCFVIRGMHHCFVLTAVLGMLKQPL